MGINVLMSWPWPHSWVMALDATEGAEDLLVPCVVKNKTSFLLEVNRAGNMRAQKTRWQAGHWPSDQLAPHSKGGRKKWLGSRGVKKPKNYKNCMVCKEDPGSEFANLSYGLSYVTSSPCTLK